MSTAARACVGRVDRVGVVASWLQVPELGPEGASILCTMLGSTREKGVCAPFEHVAMCPTRPSLQLTIILAFTGVCYVRDPANKIRQNDM